MIDDVLRDIFIAQSFHYRKKTVEIRNLRFCLCNNIRFTITIAKIRTFFIYLNLYFSLSFLLDSLITPLSRSDFCLNLSAASFIVDSRSEKRKGKLKEIKDNECRIASISHF